MTTTHAITRRTMLAGAAATTAAALGWRARSRARAGTIKKTEADGPLASLARAAEYLWQQQADDGGWHSPQYGVLRSGQALTPFVLDALLVVPAETLPAPAGGVDRGLAFLVERIDDQGRLGWHDPEVLEYPIYSSAYALRCIARQLNAAEPAGIRYSAAISARRERLAGKSPEISPQIHEDLANYLSASQCQEDNGFEPTHPAYGGWGFDAPQAPGRPGHMDLAHTRRAIQALAAAERWNRFSGPIDDGPTTHSENRTRLEHFLRVVQKHPRAAARPQLTEDGPSSDAPPPLLHPPPFDGGFFFSPVVPAANKGRLADDPTPHWRSYATATCDGILALLAAGVPREDERVTAAVAWLQSHTNLDYPQGVPEEHPEPWGAAIRFYHYAARAEVYHALAWPAEDRARLAASLVARQEPDGRFVNRDSALMKEDDPVLCTALAVVTLNHCVA